MSLQEIHGETILVRSDRLMVSPMGDELAMMSMENNSYFSLDDIGRIIWELLEQPTAINRVCDQLLAKFEVSREQCEADVLSFVHEMLDAGIVQIGN